MQVLTHTDRGRMGPNPISRTDAEASTISSKFRTLHHVSSFALKCDGRTMAISRFATMYKSVAELGRRKIRG